MTANQNHLNPMKNLRFLCLNFSLLLLNYFIYVILNEFLFFECEIYCGRIKLDDVIWLMIPCEIISNDSTNYNWCILFIIFPWEFRFNSFNFSFLLYFYLLPHIHLIFRHTLFFYYNFSLIQFVLFVCLCFSIRSLIRNLLVCIF